jgi:hypothetical protein
VRAFPNPFMASVPACAVCGGLRRVYRSDYSAAPCPNCGCSCTPLTDREKASGVGRPVCPNDEKFRRLEADAFVANHVRPVIKQGDLSEKEQRIVAGWRFQHPKISDLTFLSWIEGLRFTDAAIAADKQFQKEVFLKIGEWKQFRDDECEAMR